MSGMGCGPCKEAGMLNADLVLTTSEAKQKLLRKQIKKLHDQCIGYGSCYCQHRIGRWLVDEPVEVISESQ